MERFEEQWGEHHDQLIQLREELIGVSNRFSLLFKIFHESDPNEAKGILINTVEDCFKKD